MAGDGDYCSFTKAVEHLGDRWSLVIIRELMLHGTLGFNALVDGMPGISRSVLAARLRKLEDLGIVTRDRESGRGVPGYCLTRAGRELRPILQTLRQWSERFVPEDPAMVERDPDIVLKRLAGRIDRDRLPAQQVVIDLNIGGTRIDRAWLVLERGVEPSVCIEDPGLAEDRYVFLETDVRTLDRVSRRARSWWDAITDGSIRLYGEPTLVQALPVWFGQRDRVATSAREGSVAGARRTASQPSGQTATPVRRLKSA